MKECCKEWENPQYKREIKLFYNIGDVKVIDPYKIHFCPECGSFLKEKIEKEKKINSNT